MMAVTSPLLEADHLHAAMVEESVEHLIARFLGDCSDVPTRKALASTCKALLECRICRPRGWTWRGLNGGSITILKIEFF